MPSYVLYGLAIESDLPLPAPVVEPRDPDLRVQWGLVGVPPGRPRGEVLAEVSLPYASYSVVRSEDGYTITYPGTCRMLVDPSLATVRVCPASEDTRGLATMLVAGNVLATLLTLRGDLVLHASAVDLGGVAAAFVGSPGCGKTTMAAMTCAFGGRLITDDVLRLVRNPDGFACVPGAHELRLRPNAAPLRDILPGRARMTADERAAVALTRQEHEVPLGAVFFPRRASDAGDASTHRLEPAEALRRLTMFPRTLGWTSRSVLERSFRWNADLARSVPAFDTVAPWGAPLDRETAAAVSSLVTGSLRSAGST